VAEFEVRPARSEDARAMAELFAAVAAERTGIASEPPVDIDERTAIFAAGAAGPAGAAGGAGAAGAVGSFVAVAGDQIIGLVRVKPSHHGFGDLAMLVDRDWRGRGAGSALVRAAIDWARGQGLHKVSLEVFAHNEAAIALYRRSGFAEEGRRPRQYRRASGELWDSIVMGLLL
jgi:RimJ/RimL family protein N-acetyltransferase